MSLPPGLCSAATEVAVIFRVCPRRREVRNEVGWLLSLLLNGIGMNVEAAGLNTSLKSVE